MNFLAELRSAVVLADQYPVLAGADLQIEAGESVALTGPNGAGKTSLLRLLGGFSRLHDGSGSVCGYDLAGSRRQVRAVTGYVAHVPFAYEDLTTEENLAFMAPSHSAREYSQALERVGLSGRANVRAARLSAGQRRRLGLAVVLVRNSALWLLDEPYSGLDAEGRELLDHLIAQARNEGRAVVFSSHDTEASASRVEVVRGGVVSSNSRETQTHVS